MIAKTGKPKTGIQDTPEILHGYQYIKHLERAYGMPVTLMQDESLSAAERLALLRHWRDERTRMVFETGHDMDYGSDPVLRELRLCIWEIKHCIQFFN